MEGGEKPAGQENSKDHLDRAEEHLAVGRTAQIVGDAEGRDEALQNANEELREAVGEDNTYYFHEANPANPLDTGHFKKVSGSKKPINPESPDEHPREK